MPALHGQLHYGRLVREMRVLFAFRAVAARGESADVWRGFEAARLHTLLSS